MTMEFDTQKGDETVFLDLFFADEQSSDGE